MEKLAYRPDIDGLRAAAVLAVIAAHLPERFLPSGFLGVDVFFAISGFVVTASLLSQHRTRLPQLYAGFLSRRIRRLMPALVACVAVTGALVLATDPFPAGSIKTGLAALFGFANIVLFFFELDYFSPSSLFNAFTHTWSLGVEEQFYVVFPAFAWWFFYRPHATSFRALGTAIIVGGGISLLAFIWLYGDHRAAAFFWMPTRIWELGVGALLYLGRRRLGSARLQALLRRLSPFALAGLFACFGAPEEQAMPATVLAVGLAGLLLATDGHGGAARVLALPPVVYVGRISYSLYLWHWPAIALGAIVLPLAWRSSFVYVTIAAVAAVVSYHGIEKPLRYHAWTNSKVGDITAGVGTNIVVGTLLLVAMAQTTAITAPATAGLHPPPYLPLLGSGNSHVTHCALDGGSRVLQPDTVDQCTAPPRPGSGMPTIWAMGDSHSGHLQGLLYEVHDRLGMGVHLVETPGWSFPFEPAREFKPRKELYRRIEPLFRPGDIVLISRMYISRSTPHVVEEIRPWLYNLGRLAEDLSARGVRLVITGPPPIFHYKDIRECSLEEREGCRLERAGFAPLVGQVMALLLEFQSQHDNAAVFDIFNAVCPPGDTWCYPDDGYRYLFRDRDHFNSLGSRLLAEPFVAMLRSSRTIEPGN